MAIMRLGASAGRLRIRVKGLSPPVFLVDICPPLCGLNQARITGTTHGGFMSKSLPARPDLGQLRRQARELLRAWQAGDLLALQRAAPYHLPAPPRLSQAQLVLAREHGFASWPQLVKAVEQRLPLDESAWLAKLLRLAIGEGFTRPQPERAQAWLGQDHRPSLQTALLTGDLAMLRQQLNPAQLMQPLAPLQAPPIVWVCFSSLARLPSFRAGLLDCLDFLLAQGADPNAGLLDPEAGEQPLPILYGAVDRAASFEMVQRLLAAGAEPNDGESLYHATEQSERRILAALVQAGARWTSTNALLRQLDFEDPAGLAQALALGADPKEPGPGGSTPQHHAITRGRSADCLRLLLEAGADVNARDGAGRSVAEHALRLGERHLLPLLQAHGAQLDEALVEAGLAPQSRAAFLAACAAGDEAGAKAYLAQHPLAIQELDEADLRLLPDQAQRGAYAAVALMLALGWPVACQGDWGASALNQAAFRGDLGLVRLLIQHGAHWDERNGFGGNALDSCLHAAENMPEPGGDYAGVVEALVVQGAPRPDSPVLL